MLAGNASKGERYGSLFDYIKRLLHRYDAIVRMFSALYFVEPMPEFCVIQVMIVGGNPNAVAV